MNYLRIFVVALCSLIVFSGHPVYATPTPEPSVEISSQRRDIELNPQYDQTAEKAICSASSSDTAPTSGPLYFLGDSIGSGLQGSGLEDSLLSAGFNPKINAEPSRSIAGRGVNNTSGLEAVATDAEYIKTAKVVIVELGTNVEPDFAGKIDMLFAAIKNLNPNAALYYIDIASSASFSGATSGAYRTQNQIIYQKAITHNYDVISLFRLFYPNGNPEAYDPLEAPAYSFTDGVHLGADANEALISSITDALTEAPPAPPATPAVPGDGSDTAPPQPTSSDPQAIKQRLLGIKNIGGEARVQIIVDHLDWYQEAGRQGDVPWQALAGAHFREGLHFENHSNGQGAWMLYSAVRAGAVFPPGPISREEWIRQAVIASENLKSRVNVRPSPINVGKTLTKDTTDTNLIKDVLFGYNGKGPNIWPINLQAARELNFSPPEHYVFEGSAYAMNFYDAGRQGMKQCAVDGCSRINESVNPGAFLIYEALAGVQASGGGGTGVCDPGGSSGGSSGGIGSGDIVAIAAAEIGVNEGSARMLEYTNGNNFAWCASFVSWVYKQAGRPFTNGSAGGWLYPGVSGLMTYLRANGTFHEKGDGYIPAPGDIVIYKNNGASHTNIVESADESGFRTIGGNESNTVKRGSRTYDDRQLTGFGRPGL